MADQEQNGGRSIELTEEVLELAENYLDTCKDSYRRFDEVAEDENMESVAEGGREELYEEARDIVRQEMQGSVSMLQRKLRIGYSRASKLIDLLEEHGVVAPADGSKPRALLSEDQEREYLAAITDPEEKRASKKLYRFNPHYRQHVELPSIAGLAIHLQVSRQTIYNWKEEETELGKRFFDITEKVLAEQERRLVDNGLSGTYNPTIAKLILGKHGYTDKIDHTTGDKPIQASPEAQALAANAIDTYLNGTRNETTTETPGSTGE